MSIGHDMTNASVRVPHPVIHTLLYVPFGALSDFVSVALTFMASAAGISVEDTALLNGANLLTNWRKWTWAPMVDVSLFPKKWYVFAMVRSACWRCRRCRSMLAPCPCCS